jgi:hypothetical protein
VRVRYGEGELVSGIDVHGQREGERTHGQRHAGPGQIGMLSFASLSKGALSRARRL